MREEFHNTAFCFIGFPGAGKTTAARLASRILNTPLKISTGDVVRRLASEHFGVDKSELTGEKIGEFSTHQRENDSPLYVAREVKRMLERDFRWPETAVSMEGVRDKEAASFYRSFIDDFRVILVHAPFGDRLDRLADRGREEDEVGYSADDLIHRENRELKWGMDSLPEEADQVVMNTGTEADLKKKLGEVLYARI
jgi:dephospho-CoA kinase